MKQLNNFFFQLTPQIGLAYARVIFGAVLFFYYISILPHAQDAFGPLGILNGFTPTFRDHLAGLQWLRFLSAPSTLFLFYFTLLISSLLYAAGYKTRVYGTICLILHSLFQARNEYMYWGWAEMIKPFILYTLFARSEESKGPAWPLRLLQIHVCLMYFITGFARLHDPAWHDGSVMSEILMSSLFSRFYPFPPFLFFPMKVLGVTAWVLELCAPFLLWSKKMGKYMAAALIFMHIGLEFFTLLGWWNAVMIAGLMVFLPPTWLKGKLWKAAR